MTSSTNTDTADKSASRTASTVPTWQLFKAENDRLVLDIERMVRERIDRQQSIDVLVNDLNECCDQRNTLLAALKAIQEMADERVNVIRMPGGRELGNFTRAAIAKAEGTAK